MSKKIKNYIPKTMGKTKMKSLKSKLHDVYYGNINLDTTCKGSVICCETAMPQMNHCEFSQLINEIWDTTSRSEKIRLICTSLEYFFHYEFEKWGMQTLIKPCMLLSEEGKCMFYESRPLSCRMYGLWPEESYKERVDKFEKAYEGLLTREKLPLNKQCPYVKRVDDSVELTSEVIEGLYSQLDDIDMKTKDFTPVQIEQKANYRTFHDWLLLRIYGENWLSDLTTLMLAADKNTIEETLNAIKDASAKQFSKDMPNMTDQEDKNE